MENRKHIIFIVLLISSLLVYYFFFRDIFSTFLLSLMLLFTMSLFVSISDTRIGMIKIISAFFTYLLLVFLVTYFATGSEGRNIAGYLQIFLLTAWIAYSLLVLIFCFKGSTNKREYVYYLIIPFMVLLLSILGYLVFVK
jgi:hypothetical protein